MTSRQKGEIETIRLRDLMSSPSLADVEVDIEHQGPYKIDEYRVKLRRVMLNDLRRIVALRREFKQTEFPEIYKVDEKSGSVDFTTPDGEADYDSLYTEACSELVTEVRGWLPLAGEKDRQAIGKELFRIGAARQVSSRAIAIQSLDKKHIFTSDPSDVQPGGAAAPDLGSVLGGGAEAS